MTERADQDDSNGREQKLFRWSIAWMSLSAACWAGNFGVRHWYFQKAVAAVRSLPPPNSKEKATEIFIQAMNDTVRMLIPLICVLVFSALCFFICFIRWLLAIRRRRAAEAAVFGAPPPPV